MNSTIDACLIAQQRALEYLGPEQTEDHQILQYISEFIAKFGDSRFSLFPEHEDRIIHNRAGWYKESPNGRVYLFFPVALMEAGNGFERSRIIGALKRPVGLWRKIRIGVLRSHVHQSVLKTYITLWSVKTKYLFLVYLNQ